MSADKIYFSAFFVLLLASLFLQWLFLRKMRAMYRDFSNQMDDLHAKLKEAERAQSKAPWLKP